MTNKLAPYKSPATMSSLREWWEATYPDNKAGSFDNPLHLIELYQSFEKYSKITPYSADWIDANQFAKCLVAAQISDIGNGTWMMLENWTPKDYEIRRAKVY